MGILVDIVNLYFTLYNVPSDERLFAIKIDHDRPYPEASVYLALNYNSSSSSSRSACSCSLTLKK